MISVIIPTYNRYQDLEKMLKSFFGQKGLDQTAFEVIVVDNGSSDKTRETVEALQKGDIVAFLDDDITIDPNWLLAVDEFFKSTGADAMGGRIIPGYPADLPKWVKENAFCLEGPIVCHDYGDDNKAYNSENMFVMVGANMVFKRSVLNEIGYFNEGLLTASRMPLAEDTELAVRLFKSNKKAMYCGKAKVIHPVTKERMTLSYITKWYYNHGKFYIYLDDHGIVTGNYRRIGAVPQYLYRQLVVHGIGALCGIFSRKKFFPHYNEFSKIRGMVDELNHCGREKLSAAVSACSQTLVNGK